MTGERVSHYTILDRLGQGGMGIVYKARDEKLGRIVALKFLPADLTRDPDARRRFMHEARAASALQHSAICTIHDIDETPDGEMFIVMDFYEGETLRTKIERGPLPLKEILGVGIQIADGLAAAHASGMVHRDIKPANILITPRGEAKILDFGLARLSGQTRLTREGAAPGTLAYMSPEQIRGEEIDARTDLWSTGVILHEMLTGKHPFRGEFDQALAYSILNERQEPVTSLRAGLPMELEVILQKALSKERGERYQHADDLGADLRRLLHDSDAGNRPPPVLQPPAAQKASPRRRTLFIAAGVLGVLAVGVFFVSRFIFPGRAHGEPFSIAVIAFENNTGDPKYDHLSKAIPNLLITSLEQSADLRVTTWERLRDLARQTGSDAAQIDRDLGFTLCGAAGVGTLVLGSFTRAGEEFATDVKVMDVASRNILLSASSHGEGEGSILRSQIDNLSDEILAKLTRTPQNAKVRRPISEFTTTSLEAYNYYLLGLERYDSQEMFDASKLLALATERDTNFAVAYLQLAKVYGSLARFPARIEACKRAYRLASRASEKERMAIEAGYAQIVERDPSKQIAILEAMRNRFPNEKEVRYELGLAYWVSREATPAITELEAAIRLDPQYAPVLNQLAYIYFGRKEFGRARELLTSYMEVSGGEANAFDSWGDFYVALGDPDSALVMFREAVRKKPDFFASAAKIIILYGLKEEYDSSIREARELMPRFATTGGGRAFTGMMLGLAGRIREADEELRSANEIWRSFGANQFLIFSHVSRAWRELGNGRPAEAVRSIAKARQMLEDIPSLTDRSQSGFFCQIPLVDCDLAAGHPVKARARLASLADSLPVLDTWIRRAAEYEIGLSAANILLVEGRPDSAIALLSSLTLPPNPSLFGPRLAILNLSVPSFHRRDILSRAYLAKKDTARAIQALEEETRTYPRRPDYRFVNPLLHYSLALLLDARGERDRAMAEYRKFVTIYGKADGDPRELRHARKRLEELSSR